MTLVTKCMRLGSNKPAARVWRTLIMLMGNPSLNGSRYWSKTLKWNCRKQVVRMRINGGFGIRSVETSNTVTAELVK